MNKKALRPVFLLILPLIAGLVVTAVFIPIVHADTITVTTTDDEINSDGDCSLREAIRAANLDTAVDACPAGNGADTILLAAAVYSLTLSGTNEDEVLTGDLDITADLNIIGAGSEATSINGGGLDRVFHILNGSVVVIEDIIMTGGNNGIGGGLNVVTGTLLTLNQSRVTGNNGSNGGGLYVEGSLIMIQSEVSENSAHWGGGIATFTPEGSGATIQIRQSLISGNTSLDGGGIVNFGPALVLVNSTISGNMLNSDFGNGAGLYNYSYGTAKLYNTTISNNSGGEGGGINGSNITARNSIISGNQTATTGPDCAGTLTSEGYNLIENLDDCTIDGDTTGNVTGVSASLGPLQDNDGPTFTHTLLSNSPAIDTADPAGCLDEASNLLTTDQRGFPRPVDGDGNGSARCDIGAFEGEGNLSTPTPTTTATSTPTATPTSTATPDHFLYVPVVLK